MTFLEQWRRAIPESVAQAVRLAQETDTIDFTYGLLATAVLWPVRDQIQEFDPQAVAAVQEICSEGKEVLAAVQACDGDRLACGRALAEAAQADANLRRGLRELLSRFDAARLLQEQLNHQIGGLPEHTIEQVQAALVNIGGVMTIDTLNLSIPALPEIPPPAEPDRPPATPGFVGRENELDYFAGTLAASHAAVITGMAGVGKTGLAATLARRTAPPENIFWHAFHEGESIEVLIWEMANFLAWNGQDGLWRQLQRAQQTGGHPPATTLFNYVIEMIRGRGYLFCLDDFQHVVADRTLALLVKQLRDLVQAGELQIVITSRVMPDFVEAVHFDPLGGLNPADTERLLGRRGLALDEEALAALHASTGGNAAFLTLAAQALEGAEDPSLLVASLAQTADVERYLLRQVDEGMSEPERALMRAVALMLNYPGSRDALEVVLDGADLWRPLQRLAERHLLIVHEGEERRYSQHDIVQGFYYNSLSRRKRREMHCRAAAYYEEEEPDPLRAGLHYHRAGEAARAALNLTADIWYFVNHGQTRILKELLEEFNEGQLDVEAWVRVNLTLGRAEALLGESDSARARLEQGLQDITAYAEHEMAGTLRAQLCLAMAELLELQVPQEALEWVRKGLAALNSADGEVAASLRIKQAAVQLKFGDLEIASKALDEALASLPPSAEQFRCEALLNMSPILHQRGDLKGATKVATEALQLSRRLEDHFRTIKVLSNLGAHLFTSGLWDEAIGTWEEALTLSRRVGNREQEVFIEGNLGLASIYVGDYEEAQRHLRRSIELDQESGTNYASLVNIFNLAKLALRKDELDQAETLLTQTEQLARDLEAHDLRVEIDGLRADLLLAQGNLSAASTHGERALAHLQELGMKLEASRVLRTQAQIAAAEGSVDEALGHFATSYKQLATSDPYEAAITQVQWGRLLQSLGSQGEAARLFEAARKTFTRLGARRALADLANAIGGEAT